MGIKGTIKPGHINTSSYKLVVGGLIDMLFTSISEIEQQLDVAELPDRTKASGGNTQPVEFTVMQPMHHTAEYAVMEVWYNEGIDPVSSTYKKIGTLQLTNIDGTIVRTYMLTGLWVSNRKLPSLDMNEEGTMAQVEWTFSADQVVAL